MVRPKIVHFFPASQRGSRKDILYHRAKEKRYYSVHFRLRIWMVLCYLHSEINVIFTEFTLKCIDTKSKVSRFNFNLLKRYHFLNFLNLVKKRIFIVVLRL